MKELTEEQAAVVAAIGGGDDVVVQACAGSGKSTTILAAIEASRCPVLLLTYNKALQSDMEQKLSAPHEVLTFHALAGRYFKRVIRDDSQMLAALDKELARGEVDGGDFLCPPLVIVDEAQDAKEIFLRLLRKACSEARQFVVVGDSDQLINNFDCDFAAVEAFMSEPRHALGRGREFKRLTLSQSFRLPPTIATFVNMLCFTQITGMAPGMVPGVSYPEREVCPFNRSFEAGAVSVLESGSILEAVEEAACRGTVFILAARKKGNRKLRTLVNRLRERGNEVDVHNDGVAKAGIQRIRVVSFHSSKGLESDFVFVVDVEDTQSLRESRPFHVALTRVKKALFLVLHASRPRTDICELLEGRADLPWLLTATGTRERAKAYLAQRAIAREEAVGEARGSEEPPPPRRRDLSTFVPLGAEWRLQRSFRFGPEGYDVQSRVYIPTKRVEDEELHYGGVDLTCIYLAAVRVAVEIDATGRCAAVHHVLDPTGETRRVTVDVQRRLTPGVRENDLIPEAWMELIRTLSLPNRYSETPLYAKWGVVLCAYDGWAHQSLFYLFQCVHDWFDEAFFAEIFASGRQAIPRGAIFDVPIATLSPAEDTLFTTRLFARTDGVGYAFTYGRDALSDKRAVCPLTLPLLLSETGTLRCMRIIDVATGLSIIVCPGEGDHQTHLETLGLVPAPS